MKYSRKPTFLEQRLRSENGQLRTLRPLAGFFFFAGAPPLLWATYTWMGEQEAAREAFLAGLDPPYRPFVRALSRTLGDRRLARIGLWLQDFGKHVPCGSNASTSAQAWAWLGEADRMYECLDISSPRAYGYLKLNPVYEPYRSTRRFRDLLRQANLEPGPAAASISSSVMPPTSVNNLATAMGWLI